MLHAPPHPPVLLLVRVLHPVPVPVGRGLRHRVLPSLEASAAELLRMLLLLLLLLVPPEGAASATSDSSLVPSASIPEAASWKERKKAISSSFFLLQFNLIRRPLPMLLPFPIQFPSPF